MQLSGSKITIVYRPTQKPKIILFNMVAGGHRYMHCSCAERAGRSLKARDMRARVGGKEVGKGEKGVGQLSSFVLLFVVNVLICCNCT